MTHYVKIPDKEYNAIRRVAEDWGCTPDEAIRRALEGAVNSWDWQRYASRTGLAGSGIGHSKPVGRPLEEGEAERIRDLALDAIDRSTYGYAPPEKPAYPPDVHVAHPTQGITTIRIDEHKHTAEVTGPDWQSGHWNMALYEPKENGYRKQVCTLSFSDRQAAINAAIESISDAG